MSRPPPISTLFPTPTLSLSAALGASHALVVTPPYVRPTQAGLIAHYRAVADQGGLPVVLYNVPGRTGCDMQPETVARSEEHTSELQSQSNLVCRLLLEKKKK